MEWKELGKLPDNLDDKRLCVFARWYPKWNAFVNQEVGEWRMFRDHREYELTNEYTHFILLPSSPNEKLEAAEVEWFKRCVELEERIAELEKKQ